MPFSGWPFLLAPCPLPRYVATPLPSPSGPPSLPLFAATPPFSAAPPARFCFLCFRRQHTPPHTHTPSFPQPEVRGGQCVLPLSMVYPLCSVYPVCTVGCQYVPCVCSALVLPCEYVCLLCAHDARCVPCVRCAPCAAGGGSRAGAVIPEGPVLRDLARTAGAARRRCHRGRDAPAAAGAQPSGTCVCVCDGCDGVGDDVCSRPRTPGSTRGPGHRLSCGARG